MTLDQLKRRCFSLANRYYFCEEDEEIIEHFLVHCPKVWTVWSSFFGSFGHCVGDSWAV